MIDRSKRPREWTFAAQYIEGEDRLYKVAFLVTNFKDWLRYAFHQVLEPHIDRQFQAIGGIFPDAVSDVELEFFAERCRVAVTMRVATKGSKDDDSDWIDVPNTPPGRLLKGRFRGNLYRLGESIYGVTSLTKWLQEAIESNRRSILFSLMWKGFFLDAIAETELWFEANDQGDIAVTMLAATK